MKTMQLFGILLICLTLAPTNDALGGIGGITGLIGGLIPGGAIPSIGDLPLEDCTTSLTSCVDVTGGCTVSKQVPVITLEDTCLCNFPCKLCKSQCKALQNRGEAILSGGLCLVFSP